MFAAQPARRGMQDRHKIGDSLRSCSFKLVLLCGCKRLQIARHLSVSGRDQDQPFVLRAPLEFEQALYRVAIVWVAAQPIT